MEMKVVIGAEKPKTEAGTSGAQPGDLNDVAWKKDVEKLLSDALEILKAKATDEVIDVAQHIEMALKALSYEPDTADAEGMMMAKKDPMATFGTPEDQPSEN